MNMRLAGGVCAALLLAGCSSGPDTSAATAGGKVSIKAASILPEREMQKACEAIFGPANEVAASLFGESGEFSWEAASLNSVTDPQLERYGLGCGLTPVGAKDAVIALIMEKPRAGGETPQATTGVIGIYAKTAKSLGALSDQTKNALDELVGKAKDRIAD